MKCPGCGVYDENLFVALVGEGSARCSKCGFEATSIFDAPTRAKIKELSDRMKDAFRVRDTVIAAASAKCDVEVKLLTAEGQQLADSFVRKRLARE